jgi:hypothetical protein
MGIKLEKITYCSTDYKILPEKPADAQQEKQPLPEKELVTA